MTAEPAGAERSDVSVEKLKRKLVAFLVTAVLLTAPSAGMIRQDSAYAASDAKSYSYSFQNLVTLHGVFSANNYFFTIDSHWDVRSVNVHLVFSQSQRIDPAGLSSLTVFLNGEPVRSFPLKDYLSDRSTLDFSLDRAKVKTGSNTLRIQMYRRVGDQPCADDVSSANWLNLYGESAVNVQYADKAPAEKLSEFPYPFYRVQQDAQQNAAVTVGDKPDAQELAGALEIVSALGRSAGQNDASLRTEPLGLLDDRAGRDLVFIGKSGDAPEEIRALFPKGTDFSSGAWFRVTKSPYGAGHTILAVLADQDTDLERAARFLQNPSLVSQAESGLYHLDESVNVDTKDSPAGNTYSFSSLGSSGTYVYGAFRQTATLAVKLPANRAVSGSSRMTLHFRYSQNLDFTRSLVTVYVNDTPIGSKKLTSEAAGDDTLTLAFPKDVLTGSYFGLKIAFDLEMQDQWCTKRQEDMPWAYLIGDSSLYLPASQVPVNLFENLPSPFVTDGRWNHTTFVLPARLQADDLNMAGEVAMQMGRDVQSNRGSLKVAFSTADSAVFGGANLIVIGTPPRQPLISSQNKNLFFAYDNTFSYFLSNAKLELLTDKSKTMASFQLLNSPYNGNNALLVLTAPSETNLRNAVRTLFLPSAIGKLSGDGALIEPEGTIHNFRFKKETSESPGFWNGVQGTGNALPFLLIIIFAAAMMIVTLVLLRRKNREMFIRFGKTGEDAEQSGKYTALKHLKK